MHKIAACPNCGGSKIYLNRTGVSGGGYAANYLPGLGRLFKYARLYPAVCEDCGLVRFFCDKEARSKLKNAPQWDKQ